MANRWLKRNRQHDELTRLKIKTSQIVQRLNKIALGEITVDPVQLKAMEILLRKTLPDLSTVTMQGADGGPIKVVEIRSFAATAATALVAAGDAAQNGHAGTLAIGVERDEDSDAEDQEGT